MQRKQFVATVFVAVSHLLVLLTLSRVGSGGVAPDVTVVSVGLVTWPGPAVSVAAAPAPLLAPAKAEPLPDASSRGNIQAESVAAELTSGSPPPVFDVQAAEPVQPLDVLAMVHALVNPTDNPPPAPATFAELLTLAGGAQDECRLGVVLAGRMQSDTSLSEHLVALPRDARSVANAVMLWDGGWVPARAPDAESAMAGVRAALRQAAVGLEAACLEEMQTGPNLLTVVIDKGATVLVVGSGAWRWSDVLETPETEKIAPSPNAPYF